MDQHTYVPVIAIDGTNASGKGTIARKLAENYHYHYLNSGSLYRLVGYLLKHEVGVDFSAPITSSTFETATQLACALPVSFDGMMVLYKGVDIWPMIKTQEYGEYASKVSHHGPLRDALLSYQRSCAQAPGLVAEGRDMTTHVFPEAFAQIYLDASPEARAKRRYAEDKDSGLTYEYILAEVLARDNRDSHRDHGRLYVAEDALYVDTSLLSIDEVYARCVTFVESKRVR